MTNDRTFIESLAHFASELTYDAIPEDVLELTRHQLRAVLASIYSGAASEAGRQVARASRALGSSGQATVLVSGERTSAFAAVLANGAASMAYDFDDYLFLGHTGHSAVLASLAIAEEQDATLDDLLVAQVAANEVAGRLGGLVAIGPQNGQLWAHIHLAGAAVAAARLRGLDGERIADAIAIAFYQPPFSLFPGFFGSESKVLTAAWPSAQGLLAAGLAAEGMRGARDILEHPHGFARQFSFLALPELMGGLGERWVSQTLSFKRFPGCAYIDGPVDAALAARGSGLDVNEIERVDIEASALSTGMEAVCERSAGRHDLAPIAINFSARRSVAIALLAGELTPRQMDEAWIDAHRAAILGLTEKVRIVEARDLSRAVLSGIADGFPLAALARGLGVRRVGGAVMRLLRTFEGALGKGDSRGVSLDDLSSVASALPVLRDARSFDIRDARFEALSFRFGARIEIALRGGARRTADVPIPSGAAGNADRTDVAVEKLRVESRAYRDPEASDRVETLLAADPRRISARSLARALGHADS